MSKKGLQILAKREALAGMKKGMPLKSCTHCLAGKQHRGSFQHGHAQRKPNVLDVLYSDVCGPMTTSTLGGARYFVTFINDHSRKLPKSFWGEALMTAVDLINLSPSAPLNGDVPNKFWSKKDVSYNHLKVFGCRDFVHIPKDKRSKFDAKSKECIFVGYENEEFSSRCDKLDNPREYPTNLDPVPPLLEHNDERDESNDTNDPASDPIINEPVDDDMSDDHTIDGIVYDVADEGLEAQAHEEPAAKFQPRRSTRVRRPPSRYSPDDYVLLIDGGELECYKEALTHDQQDEWLKAMHEEMQSLHENHTYDLVNLPKVKMSSIRVVLGLATSLNLEIEQLDVKTAFLHGDLEEEIYMEQPEGFKVKGKEDLVCRLKKSLYGLKQAPRQCDKISKLKKELSKSFAMKDLGPAKRILGMSISRERKNRKLRLSLESYIEKVLKRCNMDKGKPVSTPFPSHFKLSSKQSPTCEKEKENMAMVPYSSAVGSLMYAMICTRPDITHAVGVVSKFLSKPGREHWNAVKWILIYLRGTSKMSLCFGGGKPALIGYTDAYMAGDLDSRKSTSGYLITFLGEQFREAELIAATKACKEMLWMKRFLQELGQEQHKYILHCDSHSAIHLSKNSSFHSRSKHIDVRYHWIRDVLESKQLQLEKIHTDDNSSNMMTKSLPKDKYEFCRRAAGLLEPST
ncbi:unnamed protein product [Prunus armeniaca]